MSEIARRSLLTQAAAVGAVTSAAALLPAYERQARRASLPDNLLLHVRDAGTGEIALLSGGEEIVYRDEKLVASIADALSRATGR